MLNRHFKNQMQFKKESTFHDQQVSQRILVAPGRNSNAAITHRRREILNVVTSLSFPICLPNGLQLTMSDLGSRARVVAERYCMTECSFSVWWAEFTLDKFGRSVRWPWRVLQSDWFCCRLDSHEKKCFVCSGLTVAGRLNHVMNATAPCGRTNVSNPSPIYNQT